MIECCLDIKPYSKTNQKWKTLFSPKFDDNESTGLDIVQNNDLSAHLVQCYDDLSGMTEFLLTTDCVVTKIT